jgi:dodecin
VRVTGSRRPAAGRPAGRMVVMADSVYRVTELVGTSSESWEQAASSAVETASQTLRDLRIAEVVELDLQIEDGRVRAYRARIKVSFKYERGNG